MASKASELPLETAEEAKLNRGHITVFQQTENTEKYDEGERYLSLGLHDKPLHILDEEQRGFTAIAVPIAIIELPEPIEEGSLENWVNSDVGKLVLERFFDDFKTPDVLTEWGKERS